MDAPSNESPERSFLLRRNLALLAEARATLTGSGEGLSLREIRVRRQLAFELARRARVGLASVLGCDWKAIPWSLPGLPRQEWGRAIAEEKARGVDSLDSWKETLRDWSDAG